MNHTFCGLFEIMYVVTEQWKMALAQKYADDKKSTIFTQLLWNLVKIVTFLLMVLFLASVISYFSVATYA